LQDIEHIDKIINRDQPTAAEIKIIVDVFLKVNKYANYIFRNLEDLKWLEYLSLYGAFKKSETFDMSGRSGKTRVLRWSALNYLEKVSRNMSEKISEKQCNIIMDIIRDHSQLNKKEEKVRDTHTDMIFIKIISYLPQKYVKLEDIKAISNYFDIRDEKLLLFSEISDSLFPKLIELEEIEKAEELLKIVIIDNNLSNDKQENEDYWLNKLIEKNKSGLCELFPLEAAQIVVNQMEKILIKDKFKFSCVTIAAIEDHPQNSFPDDYQNILVRFLRDSTLSAVVKNPITAENFVMDLLQKNYSIFTRITFYIASIHWAYYSKFFREFFYKDIFSDVELHHEVYNLLKKNFELFSEDQKFEIFNLIETYDYYLPDGLTPIEKEVYLARIKQKLLSSIKDSGFTKTREQYGFYKNITKSEPEHPDFLVYHYPTQVGFISPLNEEELLVMSNKELTAYLNQYKGEEGWFRKASKGGLKDALTELVRKNPKKIITDLDLFLDIQPEYQYHILMGFIEAWKAKEKFDWKILFNFCEKIINEDEFWNQYYQAKNFYYEYIISQISLLIIEGTKDDTHAFEKVHFPITEQILLYILSKLPKGSSKIESNELRMHVSNSAKGCTILATLIYSLRYARVSGNSTIASKFPIKIKDEFSKRLNRDFDDCLEFSYITGKYIQNLVYLDEQWVNENINSIFFIENEKHWRVSMEGYLGHLILNQFDKNIFYLMKENNHYLKAIQTEFQNKMVNERVIDHACISYLNNLENESDTEQLFEILISKWSIQDILEIVRFFGRLKNDERLSPEQKEKIFLFWKFVYDHYSERTELLDDDKRILSESCELAFVLDRIDQDAFMLLHSLIKYLNSSSIYYFIKDLRRLVEASPKEVGLILLDISDHDMFPHYDEEFNRYIIEELYKTGQRQIAIDICNKYMAKGFYYVRDIYGKYT
jgi:hypothetical protein